MSPLAEIRNYDELNAALRKRADDLNVSRETIDAVSGLQSGYAAKLLAPVPIRTLSRMSLGAMLGALGLKLLVVEDLDTVRRIERRLVQRKRDHYANGKMPTAKNPKRREECASSDWGRLMRSRALMIQSSLRRREIAQIAARARWQTADRGVPA